MTLSRLATIAAAGFLSACSGPMEERLPLEPLWPMQFDVDVKLHQCTVTDKISGIATRIYKPYTPVSEGYTATKSLGQCMIRDEKSGIICRFNVFDKVIGCYAPKKPEV